MFNSLKWSKLVEETYNYNAKVFSAGSFQLHYSHVRNEIGDYVVAPAFGDYIALTIGELELLSQFISENPEVSISIKIFSDCRPSIKEMITVDDGFIHDIQFRSYEDWRENKIKGKFRNQINQGERKGLVLNISKSEEDLMKFWEMHAKLRLDKFKEVPQPKKFFLNFFDKYFDDGHGYVFQVLGEDSNIFAGIVVVIENDVAYYKYAASHPWALGYRPNNYLVDRLIYFLDRNGVNRLNLGYTGSSEAYDGLRKFKLAMGAEEYRRYKLVTPSFLLLDRSIVESVNDQITNFSVEDSDLDRVNEFSTKHYKYFV